MGFRFPSERFAFHFEFHGQPAEPSCKYDFDGPRGPWIPSRRKCEYSWGSPGSGATVSFKYDPLGLTSCRIYKSSSVGTSIFSYSGSRLIETVNSSGLVVARYVYGTRIDEPTSYYEADALGSVTSLTSSAGAVANAYRYDSFGKLTASSGSVTNPFRYTGREFDTETNLSYNRARYYDLSAGKNFLAKILWGTPGANAYAYALGNPMSFADHFGLCPDTSDPSQQCLDALTTAGTDTDAIDRALDKWGEIQASAELHGIDPNLLAAIGIRETLIGGLIMHREIFHGIASCILRYVVNQSTRFIRPLDRMDAVRCPHNNWFDDVLINERAQLKQGGDTKRQESPSVTDRVQFIGGS